MSLVLISISLETEIGKSANLFSIQIPWANVIQIFAMLK